jgi:hypothetical protein
MTDTLRDEIAAALAAANVPAHAREDAVAIFQANARHESDGWYVGSLMKATLPRAVTKFLETRPHFVGTPKPVEEGNRTPRSVFEREDYPKDHRGRPLPLDDLTQDQLYELAGEPPPGSLRERPLWRVESSDFASSGIEPLDEDEYEADELRPPKDGKRYSKSEVDAMDSDQLFAAAGSAPEK